MMRIIPTEDEINHRKDIWQVIRWRMNVHRIEPKNLAKLTSYSQDLIERGINGEPTPLTFPFLCACVKAFGIPSGRGKFPGDTIEKRSIKEVEEILKPPPEMPPTPGDFWEHQ